MSPKPKRPLLWVWVRGVGRKARVEILGQKMPKELPDSFTRMLWGPADYSAKDFAAYFGVRFKGAGVYGLRLTFATIERKRVVEEQVYTITGEKTRRIVK